MRRDAGKAKDYAVRHSVPRWYGDADELIHDPDVNAVYVATPPSTHGDYAIRAMEAGKPVYVEKPMASNWQECVRMNEVSKATGTPLYVAYYRRELPYFVKVKELILSGILGDLLYAKVDFNAPPRKEDLDAAHPPWRVDPEIAGGGYFYDMACHQLDLMTWFFGRAKAVHGRSFNRAGLYKVEDVVFAEMEFENGLAVNGSWCFVAPESQSGDTIRVYGTKGLLECSTFRFTPILTETAEGRSTCLPSNPENIQFCFIRNMVEELRGLHPQHCNGEEAAFTNYMMDTILGKTGYGSSRS
jgi:predicted dehydrogenase